MLVCTGSLTSNQSNISKDESKDHAENNVAVNADFETNLPVSSSDSSYSSYDDDDDDDDQDSHITDASFHGSVQDEPAPSTSLGNQDAIIKMVERLSQKAAAVMVSDPVPQHLGVTPEEYEKLKKKEAENLKKMKSSSWGEKSIRCTIWVQLQKEDPNVENSVEEPEGVSLKDLLIPHHAVHVETKEEQTRKESAPKQKLPTLTRPCQSILHQPVTCPSRLAEKANSKRRISFDKVTIREYVMILGNHPGCRFGPPVTLDWDYLEYEALSLNEYESHHSRRRPLQKLYLHKPKREKLLLDQGNTLREINLASQACKIAQRKRDVTIARLPYCKVEYRIESLIRKLKMMFLTSSK